MSSGVFKPAAMLCTLCFQEFTPASHHQMMCGLCPSCRAKADRRKQDQKAKRKPKTGLTIEQVNARAKEAGMTYGVYVAKNDL